MDAAVQFPTTPKAAKAASLKLRKRMSVEQAFQAIVRNGIAQVLANEAGVARFHDMESLHQMRVGLRRLRAALAMFDEVLQAPEDIEDDLVWLMDQLGPSRHWDVLLVETLPRVACGVPGNTALADVKNAAQEKREALHEQAAAAVSSLPFRKLIDRLESWLDQRGWRDGLSARGKMRLKMRAGAFADGILAAEQQRLIKRGRKLKRAAPEQRQRVRIAARRVRHATDFFASLYPAKRVRAYVAALTTLRGKLSSLNDGDVARRLLGELCAGNDALQQGAALVCIYLAASERRGGRKMRGLWKKLTPFALP